MLNMRMNISSSLILATTLELHLDQTSAPLGGALSTIFTDHLGFEAEHSRPCYMSPTIKPFEKSVLCNHCSGASTSIPNYYQECMRLAVGEPTTVTRHRKGTSKWDKRENTCERLVDRIDAQQSAWPTKPVDTIIRMYTATWWEEKKKQSGCLKLK
jgi:hypothetical protein